MRFDRKWYWRNYRRIFSEIIYRIISVKASSRLFSLWFGYPHWSIVRENWKTIEHQTFERVSLRAIIPKAMLRAKCMGIEMKDERNRITVEASGCKNLPITHFVVPLLFAGNPTECHSTWWILEMQKTWDIFSGMRREHRTVRDETRAQSAIPSRTAIRMDTPMLKRLLEVDKQSRFHNHVNFETLSALQR